MNGKIEWVKLSTEMFSDDKIKLIRSRDNGDQLVLIWIMLITQAAKTNAGGYIFISKEIPYTPKMLGVILGFNEETILKALETFVTLQMIDISESGLIYMPKFSIYQNIESMDRVKELTRLRVARLRENRKALVSSTESNVTCNVTPVTVTQEKKKKKKNTEKEKEEYKPSVFLSVDEFGKLNAEYGEETANKALEHLSHYKQSSGKKYKSDYHAILTWVINAITTQKQTSKTQTKYENVKTAFGKYTGTEVSNF
jgi:predicted phage replisome organizer